jgi:eukaryotic-like serine/threonine-protein kinase
MDRHIAAFLVVRDRRSEMLFEAINSPETSPRHGLSMLTLYSEMQSRHGPESLPHFAQWLLPLLEPAMRRYFGKSTRNNIQKQVKEVASRGDLTALARIVDNRQRIDRDEQDFIAARLLYFNILKEINTLEGRMASRDTVIQKIGKPMAATISGTLAMFAILFAVGRAIWTSF